MMKKSVLYLLLISLGLPPVCLASSRETDMDLEGRQSQKQEVIRKKTANSSALKNEEEQIENVYTEMHMIAFGKILENLRESLAEKVKIYVLSAQSSAIILGEFSQHFSQDDLSQKLLSLTYKKLCIIQKELDELLERTVHPHISELETECDSLNQVLNNNNSDEIFISLSGYTTDLPTEPNEAYTALKSKHDELKELLKQTKARSQLLTGAQKAVQSRSDYINREVQKLFTKTYILGQLVNYEDKDFNTATPMGRLRVYQLLKDLGIFSQ